MQIASNVREERRSVLKILMLLEKVIGIVLSNVGIATCHFLFTYRRRRSDDREFKRMQ